VAEATVEATMAAQDGFEADADGIVVDSDVDIGSDVRRSTASEDRPFWELLWEALQRLKLPFELLVATSMFALLQQSIPNLKDLWPASKTIILAAHPHWYLALLGTAVVSILTLVVCLRMPTRENSPPGSSLGTF
jgi:hypothetical protein